MPLSKYQPISCSYYDQLESLATMRKRCEVIYYSDTDASQQDTIGYITDLYTKNDEEFMVLDTGLTIRLDRLTSINGIANPSFFLNDKTDQQPPHC